MGGNREAEMSCAATFRTLINKMHDIQPFVDIRNSFQCKFGLISLCPLAYAPCCFTIGKRKTDSQMGRNYRVASSCAPRVPVWLATLEAWRFAKCSNVWL
jgi:hypothetical protein